MVINGNQIGRFCRAVDHARLMEFGLELGLAFVTIQHCLADYKEASEQCIWILVKWQQTHSRKATLYELLKVFDRCLADGHQINLQKLQTVMYRIFKD